MKTTIYIDAEWYIGGDLFLVGFCYNTGICYQLVNNEITKTAMKNILLNADEIFFYGPDIGIIENQFNLDIRNNVRCFNLLKIFRQVLPPLDSYKLAHIEFLFGIERKRVEYKKNIFDIFSDWKNLHKRKRILEYNEEDVLNLRLLKKLIFKEFNVKLSDNDRLL